MPSLSSDERWLDAGDERLEAAVERELYPTVNAIVRESVRPTPPPPEKEQNR